MQVLSDDECDEATNGGVAKLKEEHSRLYLCGTGTAA